MPATVSLKSSVFRPSSSVARGVSEESIRVGNAIERVADSFNRSVALSGTYHEVLADLAEVAEECRDPGWDGHGALPLPNEAAVKAEQFLYALPAWVVGPDVLPEPDGSVALIWDAGARRTFSVSLQSDPRVTYALLDGSSTAYGVEYFDGRSVPGVLIDHIRRVTRTR